MHRVASRPLLSGANDDSSNFISLPLHYAAAGRASSRIRVICTRVGLHSLADSEAIDSLLSAQPAETFTVCIRFVWRPNTHMHVH